MKFMLDWRHAQQMGVYAQSAQNATKLLHLHSVKTTEVQNSQETDHKAALHFAQVHS